ncbi:MAG: glycosyltransferase family 39 protein [Chloroflexota bacterium]|nr:glycosyltransferase family 39 protein [Chloroflexota bacterium]
MSERTERVLLAAILVLFVLLGVTYSIVVPPFEASDEKWHYPMVKYIADHWGLPVQETGVETPWRQEGSQPPLYYFLGALATCWIDTSDMEAVRHLNPHVDPGATSDGNVNLAVHDPTLESFPWRGTVLAVHVVRFLSVLMGATAVYLTYLIVREVLPDPPALALGAAAVHAFTPMYLFISGSVNNDNLVVPLSSLALLLLLRLLPDPLGFPKPGDSGKVPVGRYLALGLVLGLAALTKSSSLALTVITALVVVVRAVRNRSWAEFFVGGLATLLPLLLVAGWWYLRNLRLYGDLTGFNAFFEILGTREVPADLAQLWRERYSFLAGYWGNFGGLNVPMPSWVYTVLNTVVVVAGLGLVVAAVKPQIQRPKAQDGGIGGGNFGFGVWAFVIRHLPFVICALWALGVIVPWSIWASTTWSSQGRLVFPALPVWSLLLVLGLSGWLPRRWGRWTVTVFALFLLGLSALAPWLWISPAYALPESLTDAQVDAIPHRLDADFGVMRLLGYDLETEFLSTLDGVGGVEPGGQVEVTLYWEALAPTGQVGVRSPRPYTVFVHLLGKHDLLVAQRDTFPGLGLLSTTRLEPGFRWADRYVLPVPPTAYAPDVAQVEVGLYDAANGARLVTSSGGDHVRFGQVEVRARQGDHPNPISVNFGDQMALVGYDLDQRAVSPGETVRLTLYWQGLQRMDVNYTISVQFVDSDWVKAAQQDTWPVGGAAPTSAWQPGEMVKDVYELTVFDVPPGVYDVRLTVYRFDEQGSIIFLPTIPEGGRMQATHVVLTRMRVVE